MFKIYTDGGCRGNPGIGGWAMVVYQGYGEKGSKSGGSKFTTNNEMELRAISEALKWAIRAKLDRVEILTDSAYCVNGFTQWMHGWKRNMWRNSKKESIKNLELWREVYHDSKLINATLTKVKGHAGIEGNERADTLCNMRMDEVEFETIVMQ